ncbi:MAG: glutathione-dependent formaldehyde-activating enzyme [Proteobacteria bacterium]|nr:glutathione-dependent formaldehyde-activating enzyme [Pseudomonadota bacterium]
MKAQKEAQCQCGALTAEVEDGLKPVTIMCHCVECQRRSGSPFGTIAYFPKDKVAIAGEAKEYTRETDSGSSFTTGFCPTCGSTVYAFPARMPNIVGVTVGAFADNAFPPPQFSVFEQSSHGWVTVPPSVQRHPRGRDS